MKSIFSGAVLAMATVPAFAAVEVVPAPQIGLGLPAIGALLVVGLVAVMVKYSKS